MWRRTLWAVLTPLVFAALIVLDSGQRVVGLEAEVTEIRVGYFASLLHAPVIVGIGEGEFQREFGDVRIVPRLFGAGPALIEALFAGEIDVAYVGPNPAINAWVRSQGRALHIVAGSTMGGEGFVVQPDWSPVVSKDFAQRRLGTPQTGNTQDISLRRYLGDLGVPFTGSPDAVQIVSPGNSEVFAMFVRGDLDGAWVAEPWLTRLLDEAGGQLAFDQRELYTAYIVVRPEILEAAPHLVEAWLRVHIAVSERLNADVVKASELIATHLSALWKQSLSPTTVQQSLDRVRFLWEVPEESLIERAIDAFGLGFLGSTSLNLTGIVARQPLDKALSQMGDPDITEERVDR